MCPVVTTGPASGASLTRAFYSGFEDASINEWYSASVGGGASDPAIVDGNSDPTHVRRGRYSVTMSLSGSGPFRCELQSGAFPQVGRGGPGYFGYGFLGCDFSVFLDSSYPLSSSSWQLVHQLFSPAGTVPCASLSPGWNTETGTGNTRWNLTINPNAVFGYSAQTLDCGACTRNGWVDFKIGYWISNSIGASRLSVQVGGVRVVDVQPRVPIGFPFPSDRFFVKVGQYRDVALTAAAQVWFDEVTLTTGGV